MIYFCWAHLEKTIYVMGGGGFTNHTDKFVDAGTAEDACSAFKDYLERKGIPVKKVTASVALKQNKAKYTFPENILTCCTSAGN